MKRNQIPYSQKTVASNVPNVLSLDNGDTITNPYDTANTFTNFFASIAETTIKSIKYSQKHFSDYLGNENGSTIFLQPTDINFLTSYPLSILIRFLAQVVYLIECCFF